MSRKINKIISTDRIIIDLRMQAEDLINNIENFTDQEYQEIASDIEAKIDRRIQELIVLNKE